MSRGTAVSAKRRRCAADAKGPRRDTTARSWTDRKGRTSPSSTTSPGKGRTRAGSPRQTPRKHIALCKEYRPTGRRSDGPEAYGPRPQPTTTTALPAEQGAHGGDGTKARRGTGERNREATDGRPRPPRAPPARQEAGRAGPARQSRGTAGGPRTPESVAKRGRAYARGGGPTGRTTRSRPAF